MTDEKKPPQGAVVAGVNTLTIECDAQPLVLFIELFKAFLKQSKSRINLSQLGFELARVECAGTAASAGELTIRIYPSDAFLGFATAVFAGKFDIGVVNQAHGG